MIIHELSKFIVDLNYDDIPQKSIEKLKLCLIDYASVFHRARYNDVSDRAVKAISDIDNGMSNSLIRGFYNGVTAHSLDLDDGHRKAQLHPGVVVFSTALAMVIEDYDLDGLNTEKFFEAVIVGYEVAIVFGILVNPYHRNQGFHSTGTIGSIAAAAVSSKILGLDLQQTEESLGLATTQASGLLEADHAGAMAKSLHVGNAVHNGILSSYLAKNGFTGGESLIDGKEGFLRAMVSDLEDFNRADEESFDNISQFLEENLGKFHIDEVYFKKYPFCRHIHSAIDSSLALKARLEDMGLSNNQNDFIDLIDSIDIRTYKIASEHDNYDVKTPQALKQSLPYAIAISLIAEELSLDMIDDLIANGLLEGCGSAAEHDGLLEDESAHDKVLRIKKLVNKINISCDDYLESLTPDKRAAQVMIKFKDDSIEDLEEITYYPLGEVENPLTKEDILEKSKLLNPDLDLSRFDKVEVMEYHPILDVIIEIL